MTPSGWYPDPHVPGQLRWWDGTTWTTHVTPGAGAPTAPQQPQQPQQPHLAQGPPGPQAPYGQPGPYGAPAAPAGGGSHTGLIIGIGAGVVALVVVVVIGLSVLGSRAENNARTPSTAVVTSTIPGAPTTTETVGTSGSTFADRADRAGVPILDMEGAATHTHTLLHITLDGDEIVIPAGVGIDDDSGRIAALHTHEDRGVLHVESPTKGDTYTLGQFLTLWGAGETEDEICTAIAEGPCTVTVTVVDPTAADQKEFDGFGPMPDTPSVDADGLDTVLAQGLVVQVTITTT